MGRASSRVAGAALFAALLACPSPAAPGPPEHRLKIATVAPEGSIWVKRFREFDDEVRRGTGGRVGFQIYAGGVMGDDRAMYRKMKIGQLQGAGFTMTGLGDILPDFQVMSVPFLFNGYDEVDALWERILPVFKKAFESRGFKFLALSEVGFVYTMSKTPITTPGDLKKARCWVPEGDLLSAAYLEAAGARGVPLTIPDVLASLQTGLIDTVFNGYYGAIVLQWFTVTKYMTDIPFAYAYGALLFDEKAFGKMAPGDVKVVEAAAERYFTGLLKEDMRRSNREAYQALLDGGVKEVKTAQADREGFESFTGETVSRLVEKAFSRQVYDLVRETLDAYRSERRGREGAPPPRR